MLKIQQLGLNEKIQQVLIGSGDKQQLSLFYVFKFEHEFANSRTLVFCSASQRYIHFQAKTPKNALFKFVKLFTTTYVQE